MTVTASNHARQINELYETPYWAVEIILKHLPSLIGWCVWEPAAGNHRIADVLMCGGADVHTTDIETYTRAHDVIFDFNESDIIKTAFHAIITNPPYGPGNHTAAKFTRRSLQRCDGWVVMLLTVKFDSGSSRVDLFRDNPRFHKKVVLLDRLRWFDGPGTMDGTEDHAIFIWRPVDHPDNGKPATLSYERNPAKTMTPV